MKSLLCCAFFLYNMVCLVFPVVAQRSIERLRAPRPLAEVLSEVGAQFGVEVVCKRFQPDTVWVTWPDSRIRPYSLEQTLDNVLRPLDLVWRRDGQIIVQPYEFYRRTPADGEKLLAWLSARYTDREAWERRREVLLHEVREVLALAPFVRGVAAQPDVRLGRVRKHDGYTTQNYALETLPGLYVCGTIYAPSGRGRHPAILVPSGHWPGGRYRSDHQILLGNLACMGAVAVDMDIFGWGDSGRQVGAETHRAPYAMQVQALWSKCVLDWLVASRRDIDTARLAAAGGSGGATHALLLALLDGRLAALAPVVHLVSHFDGGCPCENARSVTETAGGSCLPEILAAAMAPRPVLTVSDGGDWTASYPKLEYPFLRRIWDFYGAGNSLRNVHLANERHDFGINKCLAVCEFFAETLGLDLAQFDQARVDIESEDVLRSFPGELPAGAISSRAELERIIENLK